MLVPNNDFTDSIGATLGAIAAFLVGKTIGRAYALECPLHSFLTMIYRQINGLGQMVYNAKSQITPFGEPPTPRAAHVATAVGTVVVIQGGIGPISLSAAEDLHVLDCIQQRPWWHRIFSPEAACEVIEAEMHSHVFFEEKPDIWMVM
ncbi:hypothetical protein SSX86_032843, partial [Deinandra increscens subsp. villosa]